MNVNHNFSKFHSQKVFVKASNNASNWINNTQYFSDYLLCQNLLLAALNKTSLEDITYSQITRENLELPSADTIMKSLNAKYMDLSIFQIESIISSNIQKVAQIMPQFNQKHSKVTLAIT